MTDTDQTNTPFIGGGSTYSVGTDTVVTGFDPATDVLDLGTDSIHNQIPVETENGFMMVHMFRPELSILIQGVSLSELSAGNFAPIADAHLQQDLSAALAWANGSGLVRANTVYLRSHEEGVEEIVDFDPATDTISLFYVSVRGDGQRNFAVEETEAGLRFFNPLNGQSMTLRDITFDDLDSSHFEWRANQLEDNVAGRMGLADAIDGFTYENIYSGKSVEMAGGVDRAPYHSQPDYTGSPISEVGYPDGPEDVIGDGSTDGGDDDGDAGQGDGGQDSGGGDTGGDDGSGNTATGDGSDELDAALVVANDWGSGATLLLEITNTDSFQFTDGWTIELDFDPTLISNSWNGNVTANADGSGIIVSDVGWNGTLQAGQTIEIGIQLNQGGLDEVQLNEDADFLFL